MRFLLVTAKLNLSELFSSFCQNMTPGFELVFCICLTQYVSPHLNLITLSVFLQQKVFFNPNRLFFNLIDT